MVKENSIPILRSEPLRNFGSTFVPSRFQISGGTSPKIQNVRVPAPGLGSGSGSGMGVGDRQIMFIELIKLFLFMPLLLTLKRFCALGLGGLNDRNQLVPERISRSGTN